MFALIVVSLFFALAGILVLAREVWNAVAKGATPVEVKRATDSLLP